MVVASTFGRVANRLRRAGRKPAPAAANALEGGAAKPAKALYLVAEPGYPNFGDELIAREWLRYLARVRPDDEVVVDCARPGPAAMVLRGAHPHVMFTDTLRRLGTENPFPYDGPIDDIAAFVGKALDDEGLAPNYAAGIRMLQRHVRSVHVVGGGYMRGDWTSNLSRLAIGPWARRHGVPAMATGIGLMPIDGRSLRFAAGAAAGFDAFTVRDEQSLRSLETVAARLAGHGNDDGTACPIPVSLAPDDCFVNALEDCYMPGDGLPDVMVCVQSDLLPERETPTLYRHVAAMLERWNVGRHEEIGVVECNPRIDLPILHYLSDLGYDRLRFFPLAEVLERGFPAREGQRWISTRYHPHLLAAAVGASGAFITIDPRYYGVKHRAVVRMGSRWSAAPVHGGIPDPGPGFRDLQARFDYAQEIRRTVAPLYS